MAKLNHLFQRNDGRLSKVFFYFALIPAQDLEWLCNIQTASSPTSLANFLAPLLARAVEGKRDVGEAQGKVRLKQ
jgi:hypothetical protein